MIRRVKNIYKLDGDFNYHHPALEGITFSNRWCDIRDGHITVKQGYAHDGCSPKYAVLGLFTIGVPDGRIYLNKPITYHATLVHDVLSQFRDEIPVTKAEAVQIFDDMLRKVEFTPRPLYVAFVRKFGPKQYLGDLNQQHIFGEDHDSNSRI